MKSVAEEGGRRHVRIQYDAASVTVRYAKSGPSIPATLLDISISGCLIAAAEPLPVSASDVIEARIDLNSLVLRVLGFVRHVHETTKAIGIEFHCLSDEDKRDLEEFIFYFAPVEAI
jgi:c-di-GMP-binding flagellar brake protein YcgR